MSKTNDTSKFAITEDHDTLADRELDAVIGAYREPIYIGKQQNFRAGD
jgi:hypothetical protein